MSAGDRFQVVSHPAAPGQCIVCGISFGKRTLVDTGLNADFCPRHEPDEIRQDLAGAVYFCESCVINMGMAVGMMSQSDASKLKQESKQKADHIIWLETRVLGLESILNGYNIPINPEFDPSRVVSVDVSANPPTDVTVVWNTDSTASTGNGSGVSEATELPTGVGDSETNEPELQSGPVTIPDDSESESGDSRYESSTELGL